MPPKPPAPTMKVENWLMESRSPASSLVSTEEGGRERERERERDSRREGINVEVLRVLSDIQ